MTRLKKEIPVSKAVVVVLFLLFSHAQAYSLSVTRGPYLQQPTPDSVIIRWRTDTQSDSKVQYGAVQGAYDASASEASVTTEHEVRIAGLNAGAKYFYAIGSSAAQLAGGDDDHYFVTSPSENSEKDTRIWVLGDSGTGSSIQRSVRDAYYRYSESRRADLILTLGDNAYQDGLDGEYQTKFFDVYRSIMKKTTVWSTFSNHDGHSADSASQTGPYYDNFTFPKNGEAGGVASGTEAYYSFNFGNIHFISLDSYDSSRDPDGEMLSWLKEDLDGAKKKWIIAFWHHSPYSFGSHNSDRERRLREMRENALPVLEEYGVDLVLGGHSHSYERSMLINGHYGDSDTFADNMAVDSGNGRCDGSGAYVKSYQGATPPKGAVYVVAGTSGGNGMISSQHPVMIESSTSPGSLVIDVRGDAMNVEFLDYTGTALDHFTIVKIFPPPETTASTDSAPHDDK